jgi:glutathione S-transferase
MLALTGASYDYVHVDLASGAQRLPEYLSKNRFGVVPCLIDKQTGESLCQSAAILEHIADATGEFQGSDATERRQAREWVLWGWDRLARGVYLPRAYKFGFSKASEDVTAHYLEEGRSALRSLDAHLAGRPWLVGAGTTFADIDLHGVAVYASQAGHDVTAFPSLQAWMHRVEALPNYQGPDQLLPRESRAA